MLKLLQEEHAGPVTQAATWKSDLPVVAEGKVRSTMAGDEGDKVLFQVCPEDLSGLKVSE